MKAKQKLKTMFVTIMLLSITYCKAQIAGTTSLVAIELSDNLVDLRGQSPDGPEKWYKITPSDTSIFIRSKLKKQSSGYSFYKTQLTITDASDNLITLDSDSLAADSTTTFVFTNFHIGYKIYLKQLFNTSCGTCAEPVTLFDLLISQGRPVGCTTATASCNLVKNPSFENTVTGPSPYPACDWYLPPSCSNNPVGTTDDTGPSHTGIAATGFYLFGENDYREYIQSQLLTNLIPGRTYQVSMWVTTSCFNCVQNTYCKDLSVFFSSSYPCQMAYANTNNPAGQLINMSSSVITNTVYQKYVTTFVANSAYNKITIGNFKNSATSTTLAIPGVQLGFNQRATYIVFDDVSIFTPTLSVNSPVTLACPSNTFQFNPTSCELDNTVYTYSWLPSSGLSNPNVLNPVVSINYPMVYTLTQTGINANGTIVNTATVSVIYPAAFSLSAYSPSPTICKNYSQNTTTITTGNTFGNYVWQPGSLAGPTQVVSPTVTTIYTVTVTFGTCAFTATTQVTVSNVCCDANSTAKYNGNFFPANGGTYSGALVFNNDVTLAQGTQVTLSSAEYIFAPNVKIVVPLNSTLTVKDAHLYACSSTMWKGIVVQSGGRVIFTRVNKDNLIEDAITAIDATNQNGSSLTSILDIVSTTFNRNYVDVSISNYTSTATNYPFSFKKCVFTCRNLTFNATTWPQTGTTSNATGSSADLRYATGTLAALAPPYLVQSGLSAANLKNPYSTQPSKTAILLNNVGQTNSNGTAYGITIGDGSLLANFNVFDSHATFINATNSNVNSFNNTFQNTKVIAGNGMSSAIKTLNNYSAPLIINSKLDLVSSATPNININRFYNCHVGIEARNQSTLNVKYAWLASTQSTLTTASVNNPGYYGIFIESNRFINYQVHNSQFSNLNIGIYCSATSNFLSTLTYGQAWGTFSITANLFCPAVNVSTAPGNGFVNTGIIVENILVGKGGTSPSFYALVPNNGLRIQYNNFYKVWNGIYVYGFYSNGFIKRMDNNSVLLIQQGTGNIAQKGINSSYNNQSIINSNAVTGYGTSTTNVVAGIYNSLTSNSGVQCNNVVTLPRGFEFAGANTSMIWKGNYLSSNARGLYATNWGTSAISGGIGPQGNSSSPSDNFWNGTWNSTTNLQTWTDATSNAANSKIYARSTINFSLTQTWNNGGGNPNISYNFASNRPAASSSTYVACGSGNSAGREWHDIAADSTDGGDDEEINQYLLYMNLNMDSVLLANDDTLQDFYLANLPEATGQLSDIENALALGLYSNANSLITAFEPATNIQANFKQFYKLYHLFRTTDSLNSTDSSGLFILANQCPFRDGPAVYKARALYNLINTTVMDYNDEGCVNSGYSGRVPHDETDLQADAINSMLAANENQNAIKKQKPDYKLYPNPASDRLFITSKKENDQIHLVISDVSGRELVNKNLMLSAYVTSLNLDLLNGVYFVTLINQKNERAIKKLVISR